MNEWLSKGYSGSAMTDQRTQTQQMQRQYWEENFDQGRSNANWVAMNKYVINNYQKPTEVAQQSVYEDVGIPPSKSKKKKNVGPDPRFKRIINPEYRGDAEMEAEKLDPLPRAVGDQLIEDQNLNEKVLSFLKAPDTSFFMTPNCKKISNENQKCNEVLSNEVTKDTGPQPTNKYYEGCNISFSCENSIKKNFTEFEKQKHCSASNLRRSASDCTLNKTNLFAEENENEVSEKIRPYPSTTRLKKVHNWIKDHNCFPEKRRSVITVIGQTQTKPFSKILNEIKQRRKLAKELDKHALCQAIMQSEDCQSSDVKNLVAKVDFVLPGGKVIYSAEKVYLCKENKYTDASVYAQSSLDVLDAVDQKKRRCKMVPERDSSVSQIGKKSKAKRSSKKLVFPIKENLEPKGSVKNFHNMVSTITLWFFFVMVCVGLCLSAYFYTAKPSQASFLSEIFKTKATPWYEKLLF